MSLADMSQVAVTRWVIEEGFARAKGEVGLGQYEVLRWDAWHGQITPSLLAHAYLEERRTAVNAADEKGGS